MEFGPMPYPHFRSRKSAKCFPGGGIEWSKGNFRIRLEQCILPLVFDPEKDKVAYRLFGREAYLFRRARASKFKMKLILFSLFFILLNCSATATVDYLAVNHITHQFTILEDGGLYTQIGWRCVGENSEYNHGDHGYTYTNFPYLIETMFIFSILFILFIFLLDCRSNFVLYKVLTINNRKHIKR
jgi:hypothetical protein